MVGIINFETFLVAGILLNLTPGNDTIFIITRSLSQGKKAGILSVLGIATGSLIHTMLAAFGLSVIIAKSLLIFTIIKYAGAVYLVYVGYRLWRSGADFSAASAVETIHLQSWKVYRDAVLTNLLNPKVALFFIAFLPQFIDSTCTNAVIPFLLLGITFTTTGTAWCLVVANFAGWISERLKNNKELTYYINRTCAIMLIGLGIKVAMTSRK